MLMIKIIMFYFFPVQHRSIKRYIMMEHEEEQPNKTYKEGRDKWAVE
jgi:hypothetical protein